MAQFVSDCLRTMRLALGRRNVNDPDSNAAVLTQYLNNFVNLTMTEDVRMFEQFGTLEFTIDETNTTGVYTFNDVGATSQFATISEEAFITLSVPAQGSISWNQLYIYQDPGQFYYMWGVNNTEVLIPGYPTMMLFYGNELVFRTIPNTSYDVLIYGYKIREPFSGIGDPELQFPQHMRYYAYGAALDYARDYRFDTDVLRVLAANFAHERKLRLTHTHNQQKLSRAYPRF